MIKAGGLSQAALRTMTDRECAKAFGDYRPSSGERFDAERMRCSIDPDGKQPLSSGCFGDSGGPLVTGLASAPVAARRRRRGAATAAAPTTLPSVFADVSRYRAFITDPSPTWMPTRHLTVKVSGKSKLTCDVSGTRERVRRCRTCGSACRAGAVPSRSAPVAPTSARTARRSPASSTPPTTAGRSSPGSNRLDGAARAV